MTSKLFSLLMGISLLGMISVRAQAVVDTLIDVGGHNLHFVIWEGEGTPILLESGGGNDASVWSSLAENVNRITQNPIITYDRAGYGQSWYDPKLADEKKSLIDYGVEDLHTALAKLGYDEIIYVGHSYGGFYAAYYAHQYPEAVKGMVLIDVNHICYYTEDYVKELKAERTEAWFANIKSLSLAVYYECLSFYETIEHMRELEVSPNLPIIDLVADNPPFDSINDQRWLDCHADFVSASINREGIIAADCEHYLHFQNESLAVNSIVKMIGQVDRDKDFASILQRSLSYNTLTANEYREGEFRYWRSHTDLNSWAYELIDEDQLEKALALLKLNTIFFPEETYAWGNYGEVLLMNGEQEQAIQMLQKALEVEPDNEDAREVLDSIKKD